MDEFPNSSPVNILSSAFPDLTRISYKLTTAALDTSALTALCSIGLLSVPYSTLAGASIAGLARPALPRLRDEQV